jgi:hypothetical protein
MAPLETWRRRADTLYPRSPMFLTEAIADTRYQGLGTTTTVSVDGTPVTTYDIDSTPVGVDDLAGVDQANAPVGGVLTATSVTAPGTSGANVTAWAVQAPAFTPPAVNNQAGRYMYPISAHDQSTSAALTNGTLRLAPWIVPFTTTIDRIGLRVTVVGDAGSRVRPALFSDNGHCYPGGVLLDPGTVNGDSATAQDITLGSNLVIPAGLVWIGGVVQVVTTTQPTVEITNDWTPPVPLVLSTSIPSGSTTVGYAQTGVTGALPANFTTSVTPTGSVPRVHVRLV